MLCIEGQTFRQTGLKVKCQALMSTHSSWCDQEQELRLDNHSQITWTAGPCGNFDRSNLWSGHPRHSNGQSGHFPTSLSLSLCRLKS
ncbi:Nasonia vitripennis microRNA mir-219 (Mir219) microRNA [Biomphalaria pfeifferi]|uniref:Nasonia vitripennis microRNA mir-219 (Mir219) microRNA n=1 Tax=Biomphalaria pfeifferi TaxID=112525 RepID=A0AAD8C4B4_BIOPF|nr:Nasonia vitripennis microRNA mir-219 (Mir219) microRNA [Biomphalaria pfeifferi]